MLLNIIRAYRSPDAPARPAPGVRRQLRPSSGWPGNPGAARFRVSDSRLTIFFFSSSAATAARAGPSDSPYPGPGIPAGCPEVREQPGAGLPGHPPDWEPRA